MIYSIIDNKIGIIKSHKNKNKLKDLFFKKELRDISDDIKEYRQVNKIKQVNGFKTIVLYENEKEDIK